MSVEKPTATHITVAWREKKWILECDGQELAVYVYRVHAMAHSRTLAAEAAVSDMDCWLTIRERDGRVSERPCPGRRRRAALAPPSSNA